jgi:hypothetical protein
VRRDRLGKLYDRFDPEERFRLTLEALARGDEREAKRLSESCPLRTYTIKDLAYCDRLRASRQISTIAYLGGLAPILGKLQIIEAIRATHPYLRRMWQDEMGRAYFEGYRACSRHAWRVAGMGSSPRGREADEEEAEENADSATEEDLREVEARLELAVGFVPELLEELERELVVEARTVWEAFAGFCEEELGVDPETLLRAHFGLVLVQAEELQALVSKPDAPDPNPVVLNEHREAMNEAWTSLTTSAG